MKKYVLIKVARLIAKFYYGYLQNEIDQYLINQQRNDFRVIGKNVLFKGENEIYCHKNISIGDNVQIGRNIFMMGIGGIEIGAGTIISRNVCIHSGNHDFKNSNMIPYNHDYIGEKIVIGKAVWIGQNVNILPGVHIGDGAIIGMGTTVSKNVKPYEIVVGMGQRTIGIRDVKKFQEGIEKGNFYAKFY